jgi:hypothetical protein
MLEVYRKLLDSLEYSLVYDEYVNIYTIPGVLYIDEFKNASVEDRLSAIVAVGILVSERLIDLCMYCENIQKVIACEKSKFNIKF